MKNVIEDALELVETIKNGMSLKRPWKIVNVVKDSERIINFDEHPMIRDCYGYNFDEVLEVLESNRVIEAKLDGWWFVDTTTTDSYWGTTIYPNLTILDNIWWVVKEKGYFKDNQMPEYYFDENYLYSNQIKGQGPRKSGQYSILVNRKALNVFIDKYGGSKLKKEKYFEYKNGELHVILRDGLPCTLDLSRSPKLRPVFESFYFLYRDSDRTLFSREELLEKYKEITKTSIGWRLFIHRKSSICGKMIGTKPCLKGRIVWEHDKKTNMYRFEILPTSDK